MKKLASKITAVLVAAGLMFPAGTIGNIDFGLTAFAEENTAEGYTNGFCDKYGLKADGSWGLIDDNDNCTHTNCNGYQPATDENNDGVYEIGNAGQLYWFAACVNGSTEGIQQNKSAKAVLTADITVNTGNVANCNGTKATGWTDWTPIGNSNNQYTGTFDGQGHTISGLYLNTSTGYVGLFGTVGSGGSVSNVGVVDSYFKGTNNVSGVCGYNNGGTITNCYNTGNVSGSSCVGGVCGYNDGGTIENCYNTGTVSGSRLVGGVCGYNYAPSDRTATITNCYNTGAVSGTGPYVGGVCGANNVYRSSNGIVTITNCYNTGAVSGTGTYVGGVCGQNNAYNSSNGTAKITNCYNTGNVTATGTDNDYVGGVCGENSDVDSSNGTAKITNCYNTGHVTATGTGNDYVGGVCGSNSATAPSHSGATSTNVTATITNCYNTGAVSGTSYVGGVCGKNSATNGTATITNCYYLANTADENGGKTEKQFKNGSVCYLLNGSTSTNPVWYQTLDSDSYPLLDNSHGTVYACTPCTGVFSNTSGQTAQHSYVVDTNDRTKHICENCGIDSHNAEFTADDETNTISSVCCDLCSVTLKAPTELTYDGTAKAATVEGELTGFDTPKILYKEKDSAEAAVETAPTNAGTYVASITYTIGENTTYSVSVEYTIGKASVTVTAKNYTVKFGNPLPESLEYETDGLMGTDTLSSIGVNVTIGYKNAVTPSAIGNYIIVVSGEENTTNYELNYVNGTLTIIEKPAQTITANDVTLSYGNTGKKIGAATSGDGAITYAVKTGEDVIDVAADGTITALKVGTATVEITAAGTFEYAKATTTVTVTVNKAAVTIKADNKTVYQNAALPAFTYSVTGLANGGTLSFTPVLTCEAANTSTVGTYAITVSIEITEDECYTYTTQNGTLTVQKKSSGGGGGGSSSGGSSGNSSITGSSEVTTGKDSESNVTTTTSPTEVKVENGTASATVKAENVTEAIKQAEDKQSAQIVFTVSEKDTGNADSIQLTMTKSDVQQILAKTDAELVVATAAGDVILPQETLKEAVSAAGGNDITIELEKVTKPTEVQKAAAGENSYIVDVTISSKNEAITTFGGAALRIRLEVPEVLLGKDVAVIHIAADGGTEKMPGKKVKKGTKEFYEFATTHLSTFALVDGSMLEEEIVVPKKGTLLTDSATKLVYKVTKSGKTGGTVSLVRTENTKAKTVTVPAEVTFDGITYKVTSVGAYAFRKNTKIAKVVIGKNVTYIGYAAFSGATKLKTVSIGKNVTEIGAKAFFKCTGLTKLTIPAKVKKIGDYAFYGCSGIKTLALGKSVTEIGAKAFFKCTGLTSLTIPSKVSKIGKYAFYGCKGLKTITLDTTLLSADTVSERAFRGLPAEVTVSVPKKKEKAYKTLLVKLGLSKKITIKSVP